MIKLNQIVNGTKSFIKKFLAILTLNYWVFNEEITSKLNRKEKIFKSIYTPLPIILGFTLTLIESFTYYQVIIFIIISWIVIEIIHIFSYYSLLSKNRMIPYKISSLFWQVLILTLIYDFYYTSGLYDLTVSYVGENNKILIILTLLVISFPAIIINHYSYSLKKSIFPDIQELLKSARLISKLFAFLIITIQIILFYAVLYFYCTLISNDRLFSLTNIDFPELIFYSSSIFFSSPVSHIVPVSFITRSLTLLETITSYFFLVAFFAFLLEKYLLDKPKN